MSKRYAFFLAFLVFGWAMPRTLFSARNTRTDKQDSLRSQILRPAIRIGKQRVPTIDKDVALL